MSKNFSSAKLPQPRHVHFFNFLIKNRQNTLCFPTKKTFALLNIVWTVVFFRIRNVLWNDVIVIAPKKHHVGITLSNKICSYCDQTSKQSSMSTVNGVTSPLLRQYIHTYTHAYIHTYIHTYMHAYIHTITHTYILTYMHACIHT